MGPCTFLVTAVVTNTGKVRAARHGARLCNGELCRRLTAHTQEGGSAMGTLTKTWAEKGIKGFYPGGTAIAFRQATNWARCSPRARRKDVSHGG
jgi:hypothetical protein